MSIRIRLCTDFLTKNSAGGIESREFGRENNGLEASCRDHDALGEDEPRFGPTSTDSTQASFLAIDSGS